MFGRYAVFAPRVVRENYVMTKLDTMILVEAGETDKTVTLPKSTECDGQIIYVEKMDSGAGAVILAALSEDTIEGQSSVRLTRQGQKKILISNNAQWEDLQSFIDSTLNIRSAQSSPPLGPELVSNGSFTTVPDTSWTWGTGWTHDTVNKEADHTPGNTAALSQNISVVNGRSYVITFAMRNTTAGYVAVDVGGVGVYYYGDQSFYANATFIRSFVANTTGIVSLQFSPSSDFDGSITNVSVKEITGVIQPHVIFNDADGIVAQLVASVPLESIGIGLNSLHKSLGVGNVALGYLALENNKTGEENIAIGSKALRNNTDGRDNCAIGLSSLSNNTTGDSNIAIGKDALGSNTIGHGNCAIGRLSLGSITNGVHNVAVGAAALYGITAGLNNVALGRGAGERISTGSINTSCSNCVLVGQDSRILNIGDTNEIVIGSGAVGRGSNTVVLGSGNAAYITGSWNVPVAIKSSTYTLTDLDYVILGDASSGAIIMNLPTAVGRTGRVYTFVKTDSSSNAVTIDPAGSETINGSATYSLTTQWQKVTIVSNGSNWVIIGT